MKRATFLFAGVCATMAGCSHGPSRPYDVIDAASEPLRSRFNSAKGKVRVLMLVSPT